MRSKRSDFERTRVELPIRSSSIAALSIAGLVCFTLCPRPVEAIPVFANGQGGVSCDRCHNAPPNLNAYGRYILATNFSRGLDPHSQMQENSRDAVSLEVTGDGSNPADPTLPKTFLGDAGLLSAGFLGKDVTYYASAPLVEGGFPAAAVDQLWGAYNGFAAGNGSLQVGKFPTPVFAPLLSQSLSLAGYSLAAMPVGLNTVGVGDNRWGASYTQIGAGGLIGNVGYVTNAGPLERAYDSNINNVTSGAEGQSFVGSMQFMGPNAHLTGGIAALGGTFPLPSGANDRFAREMALVSFSTSPKYSLNAMALVGHDNNPNDGATGASGSNGVSYEAIYNPYRWMALNVRYERTNDGLGTIQNNYVGDVAFSILPNLVLTLENVSSVGVPPVTSYQLLWAGPWIRHSVTRVVAVASPAPSAQPSDTTRTPAGAAPAGGTVAGKEVYTTNCTMCHGATGQGGIGPSLAAIGTRKTFDATVAFIEQPAGEMPKLFPSKLSDQEVRDVATYIRATFH